MVTINKWISIFLLTVVMACNTTTQQQAEYINNKEVVQLNQLIYKDSIANIITTVLPQYKIVWQPQAYNGNYAVVAKHEKTNQYCIIIRGSLIEFSKEGFQNWILQDFNIFNFKKWDYIDTVQRAFVSNGSYIGFNNLLQLKDIETQKSLEQFVKQIPSHSSLLITGHSLGGNLAQIYASYLWKQLTKEQRAHTKIVTFGATAVGNEFFVKDLEEKFPDAERYEIDKDIAPKFPSMDKLSSITNVLGLDSVLGIGSIAKEQSTLATVFNVITEGAKQLNIIGKENSYAQCMRHQRLLQVPKQNAVDTTTNAIATIFEDIYQYHKMDQYAKQFGVVPIDSVLKK
jgi:triacylglycerol lipase